LNIPKGAVNNRLYAIINPVRCLMGVFSVNSHASIVKKVSSLRNDYFVGQIGKKILLEIENIIYYY